MKSNKGNTLALKQAAVLFVLALLLAVSPAQAKEPWMFDDIVDVDFVISKISVPMDEDVMIIDSRPYKPKYVEGFIPGAVSIPFPSLIKKQTCCQRTKMPC